jgi:hypothetical protein
VGQNQRNSFDLQGPSILRIGMVRQKQMEKVVMAEFSEQVLDDIWLTEDVFGEQDRDFFRSLRQYTEAGYY